MSAELHYKLESREEGSITLPALAKPFIGECRLLVSLDYDGTLRPEGESRAPADFFDYMSRLRPQGVRWGLNTGRNLRKLAAELAHFPYMPDFICTCERYAYLADAEGTLHPAAEHNARCCRANLDLRRKILPAWQSALARLRRELPHCQWELAADDPLSIEAADSETMDTLMPLLAHMAEGQVSIQRAGRFLRLSDAGFTKGSALECICTAWQVPAERLFLMGDGHNDLDAFRHFPGAYCAAPADAHPDVLDWVRCHGGAIQPTVRAALEQWLSLHGLLLPC